MRPKLLLIGGGGHCRSVLDSLYANEKITRLYAEIGIIDRSDKIGQKIDDIPVVGCDEDLPRLFAEGFTHAFIAIGSIGQPNQRIKLVKQLSDLGFNFPNIIDPSATFSPSASLGCGIFIGKKSVINTGSIISDHAIINTSSIIEHDCNINSFVHIAPGSIVCGQVTIGSQTHIGAGTVVKQQVTIGNRTIIGLGSVVLNDISDDIIAFGNPCKEVKKL